MNREKVRPVRKYASIWIEIKKAGECSIQLAANSEKLFKQVRNGVIKEKFKDIAYKFEMDDRRLKLIVERAGNGIVTFRLVKSIGMEDV